MPGYAGTYIPSSNGNKRDLVKDKSSMDVDAQNRISDMVDYYVKNYNMSPKEAVDYVSKQYSDPNSNISKRIANDSGKTANRSIAESRENPSYYGIHPDAYGTKYDTEQSGRLQYDAEEDFRDMSGGLRESRRLSSEDVIGRVKEPIHSVVEPGEAAGSVWGDYRPRRDVLASESKEPSLAERPKRSKSSSRSTSGTNRSSSGSNWNRSNSDYMGRNVDARMQFDSDGDGKLSNSEIAAMQRALVDAGYDLGKTGKGKDGVDGQIGKKTKAALMDFMSKQSGPKKADVTKTSYPEPTLAPRRSSGNQGSRSAEEASYAPDEIEDEQSGDLLRDFTPRQLRDIRRRNFDNYADENFDSESDEDNEAFANGQAEINEQYDADRAERRSRRRAERSQYRQERRDIRRRMANGEINGYGDYYGEMADARARHKQRRANIAANGGHIVTRDMMKRKYGNPLLSKNGDEYFLL